MASSTGPDPTDERLFSFSADGAVRLWVLDAEQACDVYRLLVGVSCWDSALLRGSAGVPVCMALAAICRYPLCLFKLNSCCAINRATGEAAAFDVGRQAACPWARALDYSSSQAQRP